MNYIISLLFTVDITVFRNFMLNKNLHSKKNYSHKLKYRFVYMLFLILLIMPFNVVFAENMIPITISNSMNDVSFDGKWSFWEEWKHSSHEEIKVENFIIQFRIAHQDEFIYAFVDFVNDYSFDRGADFAMLCFDTQNEKSNISDKNDYCFMSVLGRDNPITFRGGSPFGSQSNFEKIQNNNNLIAIGGISDYNDRYSNRSHVSYEFKIPLEVLGRSNNYGFHLSVFDAKTNSKIIWPENKIESNSILISQPASWGNLISPDKSLPEFHFLFFIFIITLFTSIYLANNKKLFKILR